MFGRWKRRAEDCQAALLFTEEANESLHKSVGDLSKQLVDISRERDKALTERDTAKERLKSQEECNDAIDSALRAELAECQEVVAGTEATLALVREREAGRTAELASVTEELARENTENLEARGTLYWMEMDLQELLEKLRASVVKDEPDEEIDPACDVGELLQCCETACPACDVSLRNTEPSSVEVTTSPLPGYEDEPPFQPEPPPDGSFAAFAAQVEAAGLTARDCGGWHWQIRGGKQLVNVWPDTKKGFRMQVAGQCATGGNIKLAIERAGNP